MNEPTVEAGRGCDLDGSLCDDVQQHGRCASDPDSAGFSCYDIFAAVSASSPDKDRAANGDGSDMQRAALESAFSDLAAIYGKDSGPLGRGNTFVEDEDAEVARQSGYRSHHGAHVFVEDDTDSEAARSPLGGGSTGATSFSPDSPDPASSPLSASGVRKVDAAVLGSPTEVIGRGGERGSQVYRLDPAHVQQMAELQAKRDCGADKVDLAVLTSLVQEAIAYKLYPGTMSSNELEFIETAFRLARLREHILSPKNTDTNVTSKARRNYKEELFNVSASFFASSSSTAAPYQTIDSFPDSVGPNGGGLQVSDQKMEYAAHRLVFPGAVVLKEREMRGLLMPLYDYSLKQFLLQYSSEGGSSSGRTGRGAAGASSLLSWRRYTPIGNMTVVTAVAFQVLEGIKLLNHHMSHAPRGSTGALCTGFTHNDLHMDNVLLSKRGRVAVCDFELVAHLPLPLGPDGRPTVKIHSRLAPASRQSPHGVFSESSDTWAFALLVLALITGVDPLFSNERLMDDFGDGPLLKPWSQAYDGEQVVDWDANIGPHVAALLDAADPSGRRAREAVPLLQVCAKCLANRTGVAYTPASALVHDPAFAAFLRQPHTAEAVVEDWVTETIYKGAIA